MDNGLRRPALTYWPEGVQSGSYGVMFVGQETRRLHGPPLAVCLRTAVLLVPSSLLVVIAIAA